MAWFQAANSLDLQIVEWACIIEEINICFIDSNVFCLVVYWESSYHRPTVFSSKLDWPLKFSLLLLYLWNVALSFDLSGHAKFGWCLASVVSRWHLHSRIQRSLFQESIWVFWSHGLCFCLLGARKNLFHAPHGDHSHSIVSSVSFSLSGPAFFFPSLFFVRCSMDVQNSGNLVYFHSLFGLKSSVY